MTLFDEYLEDPQVKSWWQQIPQKEKNKLLISWQSQSDSISFTMGEKSWEDLPIIVVGRLTDTIEEDYVGWNTDLYDYFVNHPEFFISGLPICFHVCTQQKSIKAALKSGFIKNDFLCSGKSNCLMDPILRIMNDRHLVFKAYALSQAKNTFTVCNG